MGWGSRKCLAALFLFGSFYPHQGQAVFPGLRACAVALKNYFIEPPKGKLLPIFEEGDPVLRQKAEAVADSQIATDEFQDFLHSMERTRIRAGGVGLAAPQVGRSIRVIMVKTSNAVLAMINPVIVSTGSKKVTKKEGCLSVPGTRHIDQGARPIRVERFDSIRVRYKDHRGLLQEKEFFGMDARIIQHEVDHLDGILISDKIK